MNTPTQPPVPSGPLPTPVIHVVGIGGAGGKAVNHIAKIGLDGVRFFALNTDARALADLAVPDQAVLGAPSNRGLGAGGDPEMGRAAAEEDIQTIRAFCSGADIVFVVAGLGGGTATGAGPVIARAAREAGALVLGLVTLPFDFEGPRRQRQALNGLQALKAEADTVICLPNQNLFRLIDQNTTATDTFHYSNELLGEGVRGIWRLLMRGGLINVDFADLCAITRGRHSESCFASAEAEGESRGAQVLEKLMAHPLIEGGQVLNESDAVLVSLRGGPDLTMTEVSRVMEQITRQCENAQVIFGAAIEEEFAGRLGVTLVASRKVEEKSPAASARGRGTGITVGEKSGSAPDPHDTGFLSRNSPPRPASRFVAPAPELSTEKKRELLGRQVGGRGRRKGDSTRQGHLALEVVSKGRFEKSDPTVHDGEDLDVPTFVRRGVALN